MSRLLCTIGFAGKTAEEFFGLLADAGVEQLVDIRQNRGGQLSGFAKYPDLAYFLLKVAGISYAHELLLAPPPELLRGYRQSKDWTAYEAAFLETMRERGVPAVLNTTSWPLKVALLCSEPGPEKCHRRLVAELLAASWHAAGETVEVRHLTMEKKRTTKTRRKTAGAT